VVAAVPSFITRQIWISLYRFSLIRNWGTNVASVVTFEPATQQAHLFVSHENYFKRQAKVDKT
jgi:hypothetical protein